MVMEASPPALLQGSNQQVHFFKPVQQIEQYMRQQSSLGLLCLAQLTNQNQLKAKRLGNSCAQVRL